MSDEKYMFSSISDMLMGLSQHDEIQLTAFQTRLKQQREILGEDFKFLLPKSENNSAKLRHISRVARDISPQFIPENLRISDELQHELDGYIASNFSELTLEDAIIMRELIVTDIARYADASESITKANYKVTNEVIRDVLHVLGEAQRKLETGNEGKVKAVIFESAPETFDQFSKLEELLSAIIVDEYDPRARPEAQWLVLKLAPLYFAATGDKPVASEVENEGPFTRLVRMVFQIVDSQFDFERKLSPETDRDTTGPRSIRTLVRGAIEEYRKLTRI